MKKRRWRTMSVRRLGFDDKRRPQDHSDEMTNKR
jgi:hypothetical protein